MATTHNKAPEEALNYLREFGLDPMEISRDGWDEIGFWEFERDESEAYIYTGSDRVQRWMEWPEGFDIYHFRALLGSFV